MCARRGGPRRSVDPGARTRAGRVTGPTRRRTCRRGGCRWQLSGTTRRRARVRSGRVRCRCARSRSGREALHADLVFRQGMQRRGVGAWHDVRERELDRDRIGRAHDDMRSGACSATVRWDIARCGGSERLVSFMAHPLSRGMPVTTPRLVADGLGHLEVLLTAIVLPFGAATILGGIEGLVEPLRPCNGGSRLAGICAF
jgi:hypothetical protein